MSDICFPYLGRGGEWLAQMEFRECDSRFTPRTCALRRRLVTAARTGQPCRSTIKNVGTRLGATL